jgi:hypothetical protein
MSALVTEATFLDSSKLPAWEGFQGKVVWAWTKGSLLCAALETAGIQIFLA